MARREVPVNLRPDGTTTTTSTARTLPSEVLELLRRPAWHADAACKEHPELDWFFARSAGGLEPPETLAVKAVCSACLVQAECLAAALAADDRHGVWGGLTPTQRQRHRKAAAA